MTALDLERAKDEVILSLIPLLIFIVFVLYAFCRHGVFAVCNPLKSCPCHRADEIRAGAGGGVDDEATGSVAEDKSMSPLSPKKLLEYKRTSSGAYAKSVALIEDSDKDVDDMRMNVIPATIHEDIDDEGLGPVKVASQSSSSKSAHKIGEKFLVWVSNNQQMYIIPHDCSEIIYCL